VTHSVFQKFKGIKVKSNAREKIKSHLVISAENLPQPADVFSVVSLHFRSSLSLGSVCVRVSARETREEGERVGCACRREGEERKKEEEEKKRNEGREREECIPIGEERKREKEEREKVAMCHLKSGWGKI